MAALDTNDYPMAHAIPHGRRFDECPTNLMDVVQKEINALKALSFDMERLYCVDKDLGMLGTT
jgi:hypothetical protein